MALNHHGLLSVGTAVVIGLALVSDARSASAALCTNLHQIASGTLSAGSASTSEQGCSQRSTATQAVLTDAVGAKIMGADPLVENVGSVMACVSGCARHEMIIRMFHYVSLAHEKRTHTLELLNGFRATSTVDFLIVPMRSAVSPDIQASSVWLPRGGSVLVAGILD